MRHPLSVAALDPIRFFAVLGALVGLTFAPLGAQAPSSPGVGGGCFRGKPQPACSTFLITEFSAAAPLSNSGDEIDRLPLFTWEFGVMKNVGAQTAVGAAVLREQSGLGYERFGLAPRLRYWAARDLPIDFSAGVTSVGWLGRVAVSANDYLGASLQVERHANPWGAASTSWSLGGRLGALPGLVAGGGSLAFFLVALASLGGAFR